MPEKRKLPKKGRRSANATRQHKYSILNPARVQRNKDRRVYKSSHGKYATAAAMIEAAKP